MILRAAVPALALLLCLPATAGASTIAGKVGGGKVPKAGKGLATVRAVGREGPRDRGHRQGAHAAATASRSRRAATGSSPRRRRSAARRASTAPRGSSSCARASARPSGSRCASRSARSAEAPEHPEDPRAADGERGVREGQAPGGLGPALHASPAAARTCACCGRASRDMLITDLGAPLERACGGVIVERERFDRDPRRDRAQPEPARRSEHAHDDRQDHRAQPRGDRQPDRRRRHDDALGADHERGDGRRAHGHPQQPRGPLLRARAVGRPGGRRA